MSKWLDEDDVKHVVASDAFIKVLEEYGDLKPSGDRWSMRCPFHEDRNPSFSIGFEGGIHVYRCFGCDKTGTSITFLREKENLNYVEAIERLARKINYHVRETGKASASSNQRSKVPLLGKYEYTYFDAEGQPLFRTVKKITNTGKDFWSEVYEGPGQWRPGSIDRDKRPLFNLPDVLKAVVSEETVYVVEGEKDVVAFKDEYGKVATTNPFGAGQWLEHHTEVLVGAKKVVIIIDRDQAGLSHGLYIFSALKARGVNAFLSSPAEGCNDISDHFKAGNGLSDLIRLAENELIVLKEIKALDPLDPKFAQKWSKVLEGAGLKEVEGVRLNVNTLAEDKKSKETQDSELTDPNRQWGLPVSKTFVSRSQTSASSRQKRRGILKSIQEDLRHYYEIEFCLIQSGSFFNSLGDNALFLNEHLGVKLMGNSKIPKIGISSFDDGKLEEVLKVVGEHAMSYAVVERTVKDEEKNQHIRRVRESSNSSALSAKWIGAELVTPQDIEFLAQNGDTKKWSGFVTYADRTSSRLHDIDPEGMKRYPRSGCRWNEGEDSEPVKRLKEGGSFEEIAYALGRKSTEVEERVKGGYLK